MSDDKELEKKVKESVETVIGKELFDAQKFLNGARLSLETINAIRKRIGLPPRDY